MRPLSKTIADDIRRRNNLPPRFCVHCPGDGAHKMSCNPYKSGLVGLHDPCLTHDGCKNSGNDLADRCRIAAGEVDDG